MPLGEGRGQNVGLGDFCHILTLLPPVASVFHKHMSSSLERRSYFIRVKAILLRICKVIDYTYFIVPLHLWSRITCYGIDADHNVTTFISIERKRKISDSVLWQKPLHRQKNPKKQRDNTKTPPKPSITQRLRTDLGRSVGVTIAKPNGVVKPVYGIPTFFTNRKSRVIIRTHIQKSINNPPCKGRGPTAN